MLISNFPVCWLLFFVLSSLLKDLNAQQICNHLFNPVGSFVNEREKPLRDELCLNGIWIHDKFMTNRGRLGQAWAAWGKLSGRSKNQFINSSIFQ